MIQDYKENKKQAEIERELLEKSIREEDVLKIFDYDIEYQDMKEEVINFIVDQNLTIQEVLNEIGESLPIIGTCEIIGGNSFLLIKMLY